MTKVKIFRTTFLVLINLLGLSSVNAQQDKPNILFIAIDDLNSCLKGMEGEIEIATPNINKLSERGVLFTNAHCAAPACNPSRVSVMTGLRPATTGLYTNLQDWRQSKYLADKITLPQHLKNNGYKTLGGGKLYHAASLTKEGHTGYIDAKPWDAYYPSKNRQLPDEIRPDSFPANGNKGFYRGYFDWAALDIEPNDMADYKVVSWAENELSQTHEKPLFLAVGIYRPHIPWWTPKQYYDKYPMDEVELPEIVENDLGDVPNAGQEMTKRNWHKWMVDNNKWKEAVQAYKASVSFTDDLVGRLLQALDKGPLAKNTIVVLWSDHGYHLGQKEHWEKFALWEQTTRVPLIIYAPGVSKNGVLCKQPVSLLDVYPTLNELSGLPLKKALDGESLVPLLENPNLVTHRAVVSTQKYNNHAIRSSKWRYIRYKDGSEELYDQEKDPKNFHNLIGTEDYSAVIQDLSNWLPKTNADVDPVSAPKKKYKNKKKS